MERPEGDRQEGKPLKFGVFYELQLPRPWARDSEYELINNALYQVGLADRLGFHSAWVAEHHFLEEFSHSSAPEVFLGAASQRTERIRLGHSIVQLTTNHPARVAERAATLDLLSHGRVELGVGEAATITELRAFDCRYRDKRAVWEDMMRAMIPMFWSDRWEYHGDFVDFPLRNVVPKPRQRPHPPLWVACTRRDTIEMAGRRGLGAMTFQFESPDAAKAWVHAYYRAYLNDLDRLAPYKTNPNVAVVVQFMCANTDEEAFERARDASFFPFALDFYTSRGAVVPGAVDLWDEYLLWKETDAGRRALDGALIGSPDTVRRKLEALAASHVDQVILVAQAGRARHEHVCESLEIFATEVMDDLRDVDAAHTRWKSRVLDGDLELELIDLEPYRGTETPRPPVPCQA